MKELSTEEKAKLYDEAIDKVAHFIKKHIGLGCMIHPNSSEAKELFNIFPELRESGDERIRKKFIELLNDLWAEKQGLMSDRKDYERYIAWLEKQGEQKPADKVEPKFKVGDWVVLSTSDGEKVVQIVSIEYFKSGEPRYITSEARWFGNGTKAHLWTIQDAKDSNILIDKSNNRESPFIFKETKLSDIKTDVLNPLAVLGYCGIGGAGFTKGSGWGDTANCTYYPATKEQRDLLFQKMHEAGYMWDTESKQLLSLKAEPGGEQKPAEWSEEEVEMLRRLVSG